MYDILVYVFENCQQYELSSEKERVAKKLSAAGFDDSDISEALSWLAGCRARSASLACAAARLRRRHSAPMRPRSSPSWMPSAAAC